MQKTSTSEVTAAVAAVKIDEKPKAEGKTEVLERICSCSWLLAFSLTDNRCVRFCHALMQDKKEEAPKKKRKNWIPLESNPGSGIRVLAC
jgi:hypothetical protein